MSNKTSSILHFICEEVHRQGCGPRQVLWMYEAWMAAIQHARSGAPTVGALVQLGHLVEHRNNPLVWRGVGVRVGDRICPSPSEVPKLMASLLEKLDSLTPEEVYKEFEEIHPLIDGNGRLGKILYNWLKGTLDSPEMPPNFFGCANP